MLKTVQLANGQSIQMASEYCTQRFSLWVICVFSAQFLGNNLKTRDCSVSRFQVASENWTGFQWNGVIRNWFHDTVTENWVPPRESNSVLVATSFKESLKNTFFFFQTKSRRTAEKKKMSENSQKCISTSFRGAQSAKAVWITQQLKMKRKKKEIQKNEYLKTERKKYFQTQFKNAPVTTNQQLLFV